MSVSTLLVWGGFVLFILAMLAIDLGIFHRKSHTVSIKEAGIWTVVWIGLAALFGLGLWLRNGSDQALAFAAGYVIEYSLSIDRKSTRLNSSHVEISYAVFCLKKKTNEKVT